MDMKLTQVFFSYSMDLVVPRLETMRTNFMRTLKVFELSQRSELQLPLYTFVFFFSLTFLFFVFSVSSVLPYLMETWGNKSSTGVR